MKRGKVLYLIVVVAICTMLCSCGAPFQVTQNADNGKETSSQDKLETTAISMAEDTDEESEIDTEVVEYDTAEDSFKAVYQELIGDIYNLILAEDEDKTSDQELAAQALNGIMEAAYSKKQEEILECVGYVLWDMNADGMPELVIGGIQEERAGTFWGREIYAVYTCVQEKIYCICSAGPEVMWAGWERIHFTIRDRMVQLIR